MKKAVYELLEEIEKNGYQAYLIGGYPRDFYLGRETNDYDIGTNATPEEIKKIFKEVLEENYGSLKIRYQNIPFEITTFRLEQSYEGVRTPIISYTKSLEEDLIRRDFVMNTLCMDKNENYLDLYGARKDIDCKMIRVVGNPHQKMKEDPLRILRAIRFSTILDFEIDSKLESSIIENKEFVANLSYYRKKEELDKIFQSKNVNKGIELLKKYGLDKILECQFHQVVFTPKKEAIWAQIDFSENYPFSKVEKREIELFKRLLSKKQLEDMDLYHYGVSLLSFIAPVLGYSSMDLRNRYQNLPIHSRKELAIDSIRIQKLCDKSLSFVYSLLEKEILSGRLKNSRIEIEAFLKEYFH